MTTARPPAHATMTTTTTTRPSARPHPTRRRRTHPAWRATLASTLLLNLGQGRAPTRTRNRPADPDAHHHDNRYGLRERISPHAVDYVNADSVVAVCQPQPPPDAPGHQVVQQGSRHTGCTLRTTGVLGFRFARPVATPEGLPAVHCSFWPTASSPPPPHPQSPGRTGHRLPNYNDQSSGRTHTSSSSELPGVHAGGPPPWWGPSFVLLGVAG